MFDSCLSLPIKKRLSSLIDNCPHCGNKAHYCIIESMSYAIVCSECGCSGPKVSLPNYWAKGGFKLEMRLFFRALNPWNRRNNP